MNKQLRASVLVLSIGSASALADPMIYLDHDARTGPKHDALLKCADAARHDPALGQGLMFATRLGVSDVQSGSQTYILSGTAWDNGTRVPVTARCTLDPRQNVASVSRINAAPNVAKANH